jgi:hypothetical protein
MVGQVVEIVEDRVDVAAGDRLGGRTGLAQPRGDRVAKLGRHPQRTLQRA